MINDAMTGRLASTLVIEEGETLTEALLKLKSGITWDDSAKLWRWPANDIPEYANKTINIPAIAVDRRNILSADENGLSVYGTIKATDGLIGEFNIGKRHDCTALGQLASGIYTTGYKDTSGKQIESFEQIPATNAKGVYVGTDGIRLGSNFSVSTTGEVVASDITLTGYPTDEELSAAITTKNATYYETKANDPAVVHSDTIKKGDI